MKFSEQDECIILGKDTEVCAHLTKLYNCSYISYRLYIQMRFDLGRINTTSDISVRATGSKIGRNQNKWLDVSCLHWSESVSEIFVSDVRVRARRYMWWLPSSSEAVQCACLKLPVHVVATTGYQGSHGLGWPRIRTSDVV